MVTIYLSWPPGGGGEGGGDKCVDQVAVCYALAKPQFLCVPFGPQVL